jgi:hypothetical protein
MLNNCSILLSVEPPHVSKTSSMTETSTVGNMACNSATLGLACGVAVGAEVSGAVVAGATDAGFEAIGVVLEGVMAEGGGDPAGAA